MNSLQWKIYNIIKQKGVVSSEEICQELDIQIDDDSNKRNLSRKSLSLYKEIEKINDDPQIEKAILWNEQNQYWLSRSQEDTENFVNRIYRKPALKKLSKMYLLLNKGKRNGTGKLFTSDLQPIDEKSRARKFVESFATDLEIDSEIANLQKALIDIENDNDKYINGNYDKIPLIEKRIKELKQWEKSN